MNRIYVQALYVTKNGRTYRSQTKFVDEGQELFDFENELKYQLAMTDYVVEFINDHGHRQFIQPTDLETIIAVQLGYEQPPVAQAQRHDELSPEWTPPAWAKEDIEDDGPPASIDAIPDGPGEEPNKFNTSLPFPEPPRQKVRVKSTNPDNEKTQELALPFAAIDAVARVTGTDQPQGPARTAACRTISVRLGAGTGSVHASP